jgi:CheY-like chemotaxis protein
MSRSPARSDGTRFFSSCNPDTRDTLCWLLRLSGFQVEQAWDGAEGVRKALAWRPEAAVVDIGLPLLDGYEVARRLRAALDGPLLLIALTGYGQPEDRRRAPVELLHRQRPGRMRRLRFINRLPPPRPPRPEPRRAAQSLRGGTAGGRRRSGRSSGHPRWHTGPKWQANRRSRGTASANRPARQCRVVGTVCLSGHSQGGMGR